MVSQTDLAWRLLQITALSLPAMGILLQVLVHLDRDDADSAPHHFLISSSMIFLIGPMAGAGLFSALKIAVSYNALWLRTTLFLMAVPFFVLPIILYSIHRGTKLRYRRHFLPREKEAIKKAEEKGELAEEEAERKLERIEVQQGGLLTNISHSSERIDQFFQRHPLFSLGFHGGVLVWGVYLAIGNQGITLSVTGSLIALYSFFEILSYFVKFPEEDPTS